ncbi:DUF1269 domain-containing protein [Devosia sp.]|uniref:DUF1269 domain-containing protein n=1 Tax=Devosia sp. TaxID=1871048 RepID=UPI003BABE10F
MRTLTGLFDTYPRALAAVQALHRAGIDQTRISLVANSTDDVVEQVVEHEAATGAEIGAGLGAASGLLAGLGIVAIPGLGPVVAGGWLIATAFGSIAGAGVGAAAASLVGRLTHHGIDEDHAKAITEHVKAGGAVVSARVDAKHEIVARAILDGESDEEIASEREAAITEAREGEAAPDDPSLLPPVI